MKKCLILIDAHAIIHRAYHALPPLTSPSGEQTNAVYGFTTILLRILRELKPDYIVAAFDLPGPTFRHVAYERYKATRPETPSDLSGQFPKIKEILEALDIKVLEKEGYEADDIIGTIVEKFGGKKDLEMIIVTGDMDALQLVRPGVKVYSMKKGITETVIYDEKAVRERYGFKPDLLTDFKGLMGDPSDNIPGVRGIGEKTAAELIKKIGTIDRIYKNLRKGTKMISEPISRKLREGEEDAVLSKELATINCSSPIKIHLDDFLWKGGGKEKFFGLLQKFGFSSIARRLGDEATRVSAEKSGQGLLILAGSGATDIKKLSSVESFLDVVKHGEIGIVVLDDSLFLVPGSQQAAFYIDPGLLPGKEIKDFFEKRADFYVHDGKSVIKYLRKFGIRLGGIGFDTMLASYLVGGFTRDFSYSAVVSREIGRIVSSDPRSVLINFFEVAASLGRKIDATGTRRILNEMELPLTSILADMEDRGISIDKNFLKKLARDINGRVGLATVEIHKLAGVVFNINSSRQLSKILFEKLGIKNHGLRKTEKGGVISTRESELEKLRDKHPIIGKVLKYRELVKLKTTYIDALPFLVNPETGRIHTTFNQTGTATGRLSSSTPNLQNIPIISGLGREIRKAFVAENGFLLVSFDYSQIELRVAAHISGDMKMIEAFQKGMDIHKMTAAEIYNVPLEDVTPDLRRAAKTLNFGILYGMGSQALAESTGMSREEARNFIDEYFREFSGIRAYIDKTLQFVVENGYVETIFGRRRYIPEIHSSNWQLKREAERMAVNMPVQGSATGDIIKLAMIKVNEWIKKERLEDDARMLLQVHDELLFEIRENLAEKIAPEIKNIMERATELRVPLVVDIKVGANWGDQEGLHKFEML